MKDIVELLSTLGYPVIRQGSLISSDEYPEEFFTYWNFETPEGRFYDNEANKAEWGYWVYFYSTNIDRTYSVLEEARQLLKQNGFICTGKGEDVASDKPTHTGRMLTVYYIENY